MTHHKNIIGILELPKFAGANLTSTRQSVVFFLFCSQKSTPSESEDGRFQAVVLIGSTGGSRYSA